MSVSIRLGRMKLAMLENIFSSLGVDRIPLPLPLPLPEVRFCRFCRHRCCSPALLNRMPTKNNMRTLRHLERGYLLKNDRPEQKRETLQQQEKRSQHGDPYRGKVAQQYHHHASSQPGLIPTRSHNYRHSTYHRNVPRWPFEGRSRKEWRVE